ncbi:MAG: S9 family peptidase [Maricaulaceae bacterium]|nr:S9 family peptidase [Maricaulaceae bacterium]
MRRLFMLAFAAAVFTAPAAATPDLDAFATVADIRDARISPDGRRLATGCNGAGRESVCVFDLSGQARPVLFAPPDRASVSSFYWASDRHVIVDVAFSYREGASDAHTVYRNDRGIALNAETGATATLMHRFTRYLGGINNVVSIDTGNPDSVIIQLTGAPGTLPGTGTRLRSSEEFLSTLYRVSLDTGDERRIERLPPNVYQNVIGADGRPLARVIYRQQQDRYAIENHRGRAVFETQPGGYLPEIWGGMDGGSALAIWIRAGSDAGLHRLDLESSDLSPIPHPDAGVGLFGPLLDDETAQFVGFSGYRNDLPFQTFIDEDLRAVHESVGGALSQAFGDIRVRLTSWSRDRNMFIVEAVHAGRPASYFLFNTDSGELSPLGVEAEALDGVAMGAVEAFSFTASDGLEIPAFLTLPPGKTRADGPFPLVVMPHGGPELRDDARFDWWAQYYAALGYAVLKVNFRGSSGYGVAFRDAGFGEFGGRMIQDIADGAAYLRETGVAREGGYCATGMSYGGYASLMLALLDRDEVRCVVAIGADTDPVEIMVGSLHSQRYWEQYIGPRTMGTQRAAQISPFRRASEIRAPVLLIHGAEDSTVPVGQSRALERAMRGSGRLRYIEMRNIDHYFTTTAARRTLLQESGAFLQQHLPVD